MDDHQGTCAVIDSMAESRDLLIFADYLTVITKNSGVVDEVNDNTLHTLCSCSE